MDYERQALKDEMVAVDHSLGLENKVKNADLYHMDEPVCGNSSACVA